MWSNAFEMICLKSAKNSSQVFRLEISPLRSEYTSRFQYGGQVKKKLGFKSPSMLSKLGIASLESAHIQSGRISPSFSNSANFA